jgi:hypothetical protein
MGFETLRPLFWWGTKCYPTIFWGVWNFVHKIKNILRPGVALGSFSSEYEYDYEYDYEYEIWSRARKSP